MQTSREWMEIGAWIGRQQAFGAIANNCSAAQALSLKQVKQSGVLEQLGLTWEEFCNQHAGISRVHADRVIQQYNEFGENYFRLSALARISSETYRRVAGRIEGDTIEIAGEKLALTPENAPRIRAAIQSLRVELRQARRHPKYSAPQVGELEIRLNILLDDARRLTHPTVPTITREQLARLADAAIQKFTALRQSAG